MKISVAQIEKILDEAAIPHFVAGQVPRGEIVAFNIDSRKISAGEIFVALKTATRDGHDYVEAACRRGAAAALVSVVAKSELPQICVTGDTLSALQKIARGWREKFFNGIVVGVTGSVGKTSTKDMLAAVLSEHATTKATFANLNNTIGVPLTILGADSERDKFLVVEAGMSVCGEVEQSAQMILPDIALTTTVAPAHLEGLGTLANIAREKAALSRNLRVGGHAVFPAELLRFEAFADLECPRIVVAKCARDAELAEGLLRGRRDSGIVVAEISEARDDLGFDVEMRPHHQPGARFRVASLSRGLAENAALVIVAARLCGVTDEKISRVLAAWKPSRNRGEIRVDCRGRKFFVDCYNASPASILDSVAAFSRETKNSPRRLFLLGGVNELGADSERLHREVGEKLALSPATDSLAVFGGNARFYAVGAAATGFPQEKIFAFDDIDALRKFVAEFDGDVFIKGSRGFALERVLPPEVA
ncbi:MAG: UDP-N-acetylmuramoyl-tripeptide--D-alanyl-D-alanine ligase [Opitutae bacterium]|nr:UDP-N-acetylmuramoyl-tripeptide--D-alanyl-D-alanine ligase [Opitutae bacterium]